LGINGNYFEAKQFDLFNDAGEWYSLKPPGIAQVTQESVMRFERLGWAIYYNIF